jgi:hypothetical protein
MSLHYTDKQIPEISNDILLTAKCIVYTIKNKTNNKIYVGQTLSHNYVQTRGWIISGLTKRWKKHLSDAKNKWRETNFYKDILEYGEENFEVSIYKSFPVEEIHKLNIYEFDTIDELNSIEPNGYNKSKWVNSMSFTKYIFMNHFNLLNDVPSLNKNTTSKDRAKQMCVSQYNTLNFYIDKDVEEVYVKIINAGGNPDQVRLVVKIKDQKDLYRTSWYIKDNPSKLINYVKKLAEALKDNPFIDPKAKAILEKDSLNVEVYKYQTRLDESSKFKFKSISGLVSHYKDRGFSSYLLLMHGEGTKNIRYNFGGKTIELQDAYNQAVEFVEKLKELTTINKINLKNISSCPQQQATEKTVELVFLD